MLGFSWGELAVVLAVALLVLKPEDLPDVLRKGAKFVRTARGMVNEVTAPMKEIIRTVEEETAPLRKIKGDDGKWYDTYMEEKPKITHTPDHESV